MSRLKLTFGQDASNVDVWEGQNTFDYDKYDGLGAQIKLLSVPWESDYVNAVNWKSTTQRNAWFDKEHEGELILPETEWNLREAMKWNSSLGKFVGEIRIDQPIDAVREYNFLYLNTYETPVPGLDARQTEFFYFISAPNSLSASTTVLYLSLDAWTTYFHMADIKGLNLSRGHYAHKIAPVSSFLSAPLETSAILTTPEPDLPSVKPMVSYTNLISFTKNSPRVCVATTAVFEGENQNWYPNKSGTPESGWYNAITDGWEGAQPRVVVGNRDGYSNGFQQPSTPKIYSFSPQDFDSFLNNISTRVPHLLESIQAIFVLPENLIDEGPQFTVYGAPCKRVLPQPDAAKISELVINNSIFQFSSSAASFAKIFTGQFAQIKISDFSGNVSRVAVEELAGKLEVYGRASTAFPFLKLQAFINGIGGNSEKTYSVSPLKAMDAKIYQSKWTEYLYELDIPTYAVYATTGDIDLAKNSKKFYKDKQNIERAHTSKMASNQLALDNSLRSVLTAFGNENNEINNVYNNEIKGINLTFSNSIISATTSKNIAIVKAAASKNNSEISNLVTRENNQDAIEFSYRVAEINGEASNEVQEFNLYSANVENMLQISGSAISLANTAASSVISVASSAGMGTLAGGPIGAAAGAVAGLVSTGAGVVHGFMQIENNQDIAVHGFRKTEVIHALQQQWEYRANPINYTHTNGNITTSYSLAQGYSINRKIADESYAKDEIIAEKAFNSMNTIINSVHSTEVNTSNTAFEAAEEIAEDSKATGLDISLASRNVALAASLANKNTSEINANASKNLADANAIRERTSSLANVDTEMSLTRAKPISKFGTETGGSLDSFGLRGLEISVERISKADEKTVENAFRKYGYRVPEIWVENPVLGQMSNFTYWEASDAWIVATTLADEIAILIKRMFLNGVFLWENPDRVRMTPLGENL